MENPKLIYVCSAYKGIKGFNDDVNMNKIKARRFCSFVLSTGNVPFAPHLIYPQFLDDGKPDERETGLMCAFEVMYYCKELWCFGTKISGGMNKELEMARKLRIPILLFDGSCNRIEAAEKEVING